MAYDAVITAMEDETASAENYEQYRIAALSKDRAKTIIERKLERNEISIARMWRALDKPASEDGE